MALEKIDRPVLYSAMTTLAYNINKQFYGDLHYMWCTPYFGSDFTSPVFTVPKSSSPLEIYNELKKAVDSGDLHDTLIEAKRLGARRGADVMEKRGKITAEQAQEIRTICKIAPRDQFKPLLCVLPRKDALPYNQVVDVKSKAHPLSQEYVVADVPQTAFDVIRIG
ncbi:MAG: hypothetical protein EON56_04565 [Alphaproteobacteria bacterium]|nr:MAG: hypothetical protein EON56_04565 [Alphaproteobacteria bacterium]